MSAHASVHRARSVLGAGVARTQIVRGRIAALPASAVSFCFNFKAHGRGRREFILKYSQILRCAVGLHGDFLIFPFWRKEREFCKSLKSSLRKQWIYCGWRRPAVWVSGKEKARCSYSCATVLFPFFFPFLSFFLLFILHYHALAPHPPQLSVALQLCILCCFSPAVPLSCVQWQQQSKIDWNADLRSTGTQCFRD